MFEKINQNLKLIMTTFQNDKPTLLLAVLVVTMCVVLTWFTLKLVSRYQKLMPLFLIFTCFLTFNFYVDISIEIIEIFK